MGKHDETAHFLHIPKQLKFRQRRPNAFTAGNVTSRMRRLGALNRRG